VALLQIFFATCKTDKHNIIHYTSLGNAVLASVS